MGTKISARVAGASYPSPPSSAPSPDHHPARHTYTFRVQVEDLLHEGDAVGSSLTAPRACSSEYIAALQSEGDRFRLYQRRAGEPKIGERAEDALIEDIRKRRERRLRVDESFVGHRVLFPISFLLVGV